MKKSFMTRVLAVTMSAAMAFSLSSANMVTASAANSSAALNTTFKTLTVGKHFNYKLYLSKNTANWKISTVKTSNKSICTIGTKGKEAEAVYLKAKGEGSATITVNLKTSKRKTNNTKKLKCKVKVKPAQTTPDNPDNPNNPSEEKLTATAAASDASTVKVAFSQAIDKDSVTKDSFKFADTSVSVTNAVVSEDGKTVDLTISGAKENTTYTMTVSGVKVAGKVQADVPVEFTTPDVDFKLVLEAGKTVLNSNGADQTVVTCKVVDKSGNAVTGKKMEVAFTATDGNFADKSVSVKDNGIAENMYTSESFATPKTAYLTATVVESDVPEFRGMTITTSVLLTPDADKVDSSVGAIITSAEAATADRVIAYFDKEVHAKDFQTDGGYTDTSKFTAKVYSGLDNSFNKEGTAVRSCDIVGILDVEGAPNALQLLVSRPMIDNSNVLVEFNDKRNKVSVINSASSARFKLTDARQPSMLNVECTDFRTLKVTFSEAVLPWFLADADAKKFAADIVANYKIDGYPLSDYNVVDSTKYTTSVDTDSNKENNEPARISEKIKGYDDPTTDDGEIIVGEFKKGADKRNEVTIKLGTGKELSSGAHSLQAVNVGDWAASSDLERNTITTQTFDFKVAVDDSAPGFNVDVQSPEQYTVTFTSPVRVVDANDTIKTQDSSNSTLRKSVIELQKYDGKNWVTVSDVKHNTSGDGKNQISVSGVKGLAGNEVPANQYIVEVQNDWTEVYNTETTTKNYMNDRYALYIAKDKICNTSNGKKNPELRIELPLQRDNTSPKIEDAVPAFTESGKETTSFYVTMNEPIKLSANANQPDTLTPSERQSKGLTGADNKGVPVPFVYFEKQEGTNKRIDAEINTSEFADAYDKTFLVKPKDDLDAGTWDLVVGSISDDVGNTAETLVKPITITKETVSTDFRIVWAAVSSLRYYDEKNGLTDGYGSYIFVKFNKPVALTGGSANALSTSNYTLGGAPLPQNTDILSDIQGYDDHDNVVDSITIRLPQGSVTQKEYTVSGKDAILNISQSIKSRDGEMLANGGEKKMPLYYGVAGLFAGQTTKGDAVWGNDPSEMSEQAYLGTEKGKIADKDYYEELLKALKNDQYREIKLTKSIDLDDESCKKAKKLIISRPVDIDLNGCNIYGNIDISTTTAVDEIRIKNTQVSTKVATIYGSKDNLETEYTLKLTTPWVKRFVVEEGVVIEKNGQSKFSTDLNGIYKDTFHNFGTIKGVIITAANEVGFDNRGIINGDFEIKTSTTVNLSGSYDATHFTATAHKISVNESATINFVVGDAFNPNINLTGVTIDVNKDATINLDTGVTGQPTIIAQNTKVTVKGENARLGEVTLQQQGEKAEAVKVDKDDPNHKENAGLTTAQTAVNNVVNAISASAITVDAGTVANTSLGTISGFANTVDGMTIRLSTTDAYFTFNTNGELILKQAYTGKQLSRTIPVEVTVDGNATAKKAVSIKVTFIGTES